MISAAWIRQSMGGMFSRAEDRDRVLDESAKSDVATIAQLWGEGMALDLRADLGSIDAPVTVVVAVDPSADTERHLEPWRSATAAIPDVERGAVERTSLRDVRPTRGVPRPRGPCRG